MSDLLSYLESHLRFAPGQKGANRKAHCPRPDRHAHGDKNPSLSVDVESGLLKCFVCGLEGNIYQVAREQGWPDPPRNGNGSPQRSSSAARQARPAQRPDSFKGHAITEWYDYQNARGEILYSVGRTDTKEFPVWCRGSWGLKDKGVQKVLYRLPRIKDASEIFIVEGEKDVHALEGIGLTATTPPGGAGKWRPEFSEVLRERNIAILPDNDGPGKKHAEQVAASLAGIAASIKILGLPGLPGAGDVSDWLAGKDRLEAAEELSKFVDGVPEWRSEQPDSESARAFDLPDSESKGRPDTNSSLPAINVGNQDLDKVTRAALDALVAGNRPAYIFRHGALSRIERDENGAPVIRELTVDRVRYELARRARFQIKKKGEDKFRPAHPPLAVCKNILATPDHPFPALTRITRVPVFAPDGSLPLEPGYQEGGRVYYAPDPGFQLPDVPKSPSRDDLSRARGLIDSDLLDDFPFASGAEKTNAVGLYVLPYARDMIDGPTPLHLIEKPCPGTGGSLLADAISFPAAGRSIAATTEGRDEEEWRKRITAKMATGPAFVLLDNLRRRLDSANVSAAVTATSWEDRRLGHSEMIHIPVRCVWIATGNNPALSGEIARRTVRIRLDAKNDRPWLRTGFKHPDLREWMAAHRADLVWAALIIVRWWIAKGRPKAKDMPRLGMFEGWSEVVGGILAAAEYKGFLSNLEDFYAASDTEGSAWRGFVEAWWSKYPKKEEVGVADLFPLAEELPLGAGKKRSQKTRLGIMLRGVRDRRFGDYQIVMAGKKNGAQTFQLISVAHKPHEP